MSGIRAFRPKRAWEEYYIAFDFFRDVEDGATITGAAVTVTDEAGTDRTDVLTVVGKQVVSTPRVNVWVCGGTPQTYTISCKATLSSGEKYQIVAYQEVLDG